MDHQRLEINVISANDLKKVNWFGKMRVYTIISITGDTRASQQQRTSVDRTGNASPTWNFPVSFTVAQGNYLSLAVTFRIRCKLKLGDKDIGDVHVPLSELIGSVEDENGNLQPVTYQVLRPSGKPKGELTFSYKWGETMVNEPAIQESHEPATVYPAQVGSQEPVYPAQVRFGSAYPPPPMGYSYQPQLPGYGYPPPQPGYEYPPIQQPQRNNRFGLDANLLGGVLGKVLLGDVISDGFNHLGSGGGGECGGGCGGDGGGFGST